MPAKKRRKSGKRMGHFIGEVLVKWLKDGRKVQLLEEFAFVDVKQKKWLASKGRKVDGASIPRFLWAITGSPFVGKYRRASVIHDVYCEDRTEPYQDVHRMFYQAMLADGLSEGKAKEMYAAVASFGPRWDKDGKDLDDTPGEDDYFYNP